MSGKKPLILYVLKILETETDERHPMTQTELTSIIASAMPATERRWGATSTPSSAWAIPS